MADEERLDDFATRAAHQLGEAVALLRGNLATLEARADPSLAETVRGLRAAADRTQRVGDDLLDLIAAGRHEATSATAGLGDALQAAREQLDDDLRRAQASVTAEALPRVQADPSGVERLMAHAVRAALAAGASLIEVAAREDGTRVRVEIRDDGQPPEGADFEPFSFPRGRGALVGAGVSLTVCRRIVEGHGGEIAIATEGPATVLRFSLPAIPADAPTPLRVLLSDDVPELRSLLRRRLEADGGVVVVGEADDGETTLRLAAEREPEVVVLDLELLDLGAEELIDRLRRAAPDAAIVTFSGHDPEVVAGAAASAITVHLPKTTDLAAVGRTVREVGSRQRAG
jgi:CheY-like chemotaxis protein